MLIYQMCTTLTLQNCFLKPKNYAFIYNFQNLQSLDPLIVYLQPKASIINAYHNHSYVNMYNCLSFDVKGHNL